MEHRTEEGVPLLRLRCTMSVFVILSAVIAYRPIRIKETDYRYRDKKFRNKSTLVIKFAAKLAQNSDKKI